MIEQGSPEWHALRAGRLTASDFVDILPGKSGKYLAAREELLLAKAFERTSGQAVHSISSKSLSWGKDVEAFAREAYQIHTGHLAELCAFRVHPKYPFIGASPDFIVDPNGGGEMKCPHNEAVHMRTWRDGMPADHMPQVQGNILVGEAEWWDFCSYDPRAAEHLRLYVQRIHRDDVYIARLEKELLKFNSELNLLCQEFSAEKVQALLLERAA